MRHRKTDKVMSLVICIMCACLGYLVAGCVDESGNLSFESVIAGLPSAFNSPISTPVTKYTLVCVLIGLIIGAYIAVYYYISRKKWRWGEEHGSAEWADVAAINKKLAPPKKKDGTYKEPSRIYSEHLRISLNPDRTHLNNNAIVIAGSGKGKSLNIISPNILECSGSYIITDPKKELLRTYGNYLKEKGYAVKVLDLIDFDLSDHYNPFVHIRSTDDIPELVELIWKAKSDPKATKGDPIWEDSAKSLVEGLFYYLFLENETHKMPITFRSAMRMLTDLSLGKKHIEAMQKKMLALLAKNKDHPAAIKYLAAMSGAEDTVKSVLFSATGRMASFYDEKLLRIFDDDDMDFRALGMGYEDDKTKPTVLFFCIPDGDTRWNFVVSLAYMQAFKELYYAADHECKNNRGQLPIPVTNFLDEFANIPLPDSFPDLLSTMRGRNISAVIVLQDPSQLEQMYEKKHRSMRGNCDVTIYLGGSEYETHEWVSKRLGPGTIDKRSTGRSFGHSGSESRTDDTMGRELMKPDEVGKLLYNELIILVAGYDPIKDTKYPTLSSPAYQLAKSLGDYEHKPRQTEKEQEEKAGEGEKTKEAQEKEPVFTEISEEEADALVSTGEATLHTFYLNTQPFVLRPTKQKYEQLEKFKGFSDAQIDLIKTALSQGCTAETILEYITKDMKPKKIRVIMQTCLAIKF